MINAGEATIHFRAQRRGGGMAVCWRARNRRKVPVIGFLGTTSQSTWSQPVAAFEQRLSELGWVVGRTINIDYRWTEGRNEQAPAIGRSVGSQRKVDIIVAGGNAVAAAKQATTSIPIVFPVAVDPVGSGFVDNLSRPGGNVTGLSLQGPDVAGKRLELLRGDGPRSAPIGNHGRCRLSRRQTGIVGMSGGCRALGLEVTVLELREPMISRRPLSRPMAAPKLCMS